MKRAIFVALATAWAGCATTTASGNHEGSSFKDQFPSREALQRIAAAPPPAKLAPGEAPDVDGWTLAGPLPDTLDGAAHPDDGSPFQQLLAEEAARRQGNLTLPESMHCVAREEGRYLLANDKLPGPRLATFIAARCGSLASDVRMQYQTGTVGPNPAPAMLLEHARGVVSALLHPLPGDAPLQAGVWYGHEHGRVVILAAAASRHATLAPVALVPGPDGTVNVRGELLAPAEHVEALINRGHYGFARCAVDPGLTPPSFAVSCPVDASDRAAWVEIAAFPPGRVLGTVVARFLAFPSGAPPDAPVDTAFVARAVPAGPDPRAQLLALLNEVRAGAGLPPVELAERESSIAAAVAPHYFAALAGSEPPDVAERVALGLRAGWEVDGDIRSSEFAYGLVEHSDDLGRLLDAVLDRPGGRAALLDHAARSVALGPLLAPDRQLVGLVASSYQLFVASDHQNDAHRLLGRYTKARVSHQLAPPVAVRELDDEARAAVGRVVRGESGPRAALNDMLQHAVAGHPGYPFRGYMFELSSLDDLTFSPELLRLPLAGVGIGVGHYRPAGSPWSRLIVYILAATAPHSSVSATRPAHTM